jgi:DNA-binding LacI/PurR family transcriptional regulator
MTSNKRSNSQDVADLAGVSQASVSRAFTRGASISPKTKAKIFSAAAKLGYTPNIIARSLSKKQSGLVGVLFANWEHPKAAEILKGLCVAITAQGFKPIVQSAGVEVSADTAFTDFLCYQVDGVIVFSTSPSATMSAQCLRNNVPVVILNHTTPGITASFITINSHNVGRQIANALSRPQRKRIAIVSADSQNQVVLGIRNAVAETLSDFPDATIVSERTGIRCYESGRSTMLDLWNEDDKPDALICTSDYTALGALSACRNQLKLTVPEDISIIGLGDIAAASWEEHNLSTVKIPHDELVQVAVDTLINKIDSQSVVPNSIQLDAQLILRGTTDEPVL